MGAGRKPGNAVGETSCYASFCNSLIIVVSIVYGESILSISKLLKMKPFSHCMCGVHVCIPIFAYGSIWGPEVDISNPPPTLSHLFQEAGILNQTPSSLIATELLIHLQKRSWK